MNKRILYVLIASLFIIGISQIMALDSYAGINYHSGKFESKILEAKPKGIGFKIGKYLNDNVAIEGRYLTGSSADTIELAYLGDVDVSLDHILSFLVKGDIQLKNELNMYGLIGMSSGEGVARVGTYEEKADDQGLSYGFGIEGKIADSAIVEFEYISYVDSDKLDYSGINLGIKFTF